MIQCGIVQTHPIFRHNLNKLGWLFYITSFHQGFNSSGPHFKFEQLQLLCGRLNIFRRRNSQGGSFGLLWTGLCKSQNLVHAFLNVFLQVVYLTSFTLDCIFWDFRSSCFFITGAFYVAVISVILSTSLSSPLPVTHTQKGKESCDLKVLIKIFLLFIK